MKRYCCDGYCNQGRDCPLRPARTGLLAEAMSDTKEYRLWEPPPVVGYWAMPNANTRGMDYLLPMTRKPNAFIRLMWRVCFGIHWQDERRDGNV